jgi:23S rRNA (uracil1939-C5)-methyltransferase
MNEKVVVTCTDLTHNGLGVCKYNGQTIFVPHLLIGEEAQVHILAKRKNFYEAKVVERLKDSKDRVVPKCRYYYNCGGCHLQHLSYEGQLKFKQNKVIEVLKRIGNINVPVDVCIGMEEPWNYRNKVQVPFGVDKKGKIIAGFYRQGTHDIIDMDNCDIENDIGDRIINTLKLLFKKMRVEIYDEDKRTGVIRHVLIRTGIHTKDIMVVFITNVDSFPGRNNLVKALKEAHPEITTIVQNINKRDTNVILGTQERILYGKGYIEDYLCGNKFKISAMSFYQINPIQTEKLYNKAVEYADLKGDEIVLDAYCGIGTIGLTAARKAKKVIGVEIVEDAIKDAKNNARNNGISNAEFYCADASEFMNEFSQTNQKVDVVFIDPPRKGSDETFLRSLIKLNPKRVVYVSCEPSTLARDLNFIVNNSNYEVKKVTPVDMFPQTFHVECVVLMTNVKNK